MMCFLCIELLLLGLGASLVEQLFQKNECLKRFLKNTGTISKRTERELFEKNG